MTRWGVHLKDGSPEILVEGSWGGPMICEDGGFFEFRTNGSIVALFAKDSVAAMIEYGSGGPSEQPPPAGITPTALSEYDREILTEVLDDLQRLMDGSPPGGCYWCGFNPHRDTCSGVEKIRYLEGLLGKEASS